MHLRFLILFIFLFWNIKGHSGSSASGPFSTSLSDLNSINDKKNKIEECPNETTVDGISQTSLDYINDHFIPLKKNDYCTPPTSGKFCDQVNSLCKLLIGNERCHSPLIEQRFNSAQFRQISKIMVENIFNKIKNDENFYLLCCGPKNKDCHERFLKTTLAIVPGSGVSDFIGVYQPRQHQIHLSWALISRESSIQQLEYVLAHELGHACHFSRHPNSITILHKNFFNLMQEISKLDMKNTFGDKTLECIDTALKNEFKRWGQGKDINSWYREAYADLMAATRMKKYLHWQVLCNADNDQVHANPKKYWHCLIDRPPLKSHFCGKNK